MKIFGVGETGMIIWGICCASVGLIRANNIVIAATKYAGVGRHLAALSKQEIVSFEKV